MIKKVPVTSLRILKFLIFIGYIMFSISNLQLTTYNNNQFYHRKTATSEYTILQQIYDITQMDFIKYVQVDNIYKIYLYSNNQIIYAGECNSVEYATIVTTAKILNVDVIKHTEINIVILLILGFVFVLIFPTKTKVLVIQN